MIPFFPPIYPKIRFLPPVYSKEEYLPVRRSYPERDSELEDLAVFGGICLVGISLLVFLNWFSIFPQHSQSKPQQSGQQATQIQYDSLVLNYNQDTKDVADTSKFRIAPDSAYSR